MEPVFSHEELKRLEKSHPEGLPSGAIVELLKQRGVTLAEATFRKYVQLGLLPRSKRVGRKGKHRGSHGLYPAAIVGRIAEIRRLMDSGLTLEEIQRSSVAYALDIEGLLRSTDGIVQRLEEELESRGNNKGAAAAKVKAIRAQAEALAEALTQATQEILPAQPAPVVEEDPAEIARQAARALGGGGRRPARAPAAAHVGKKRPGLRPGQNR